MRPKGCCKGTRRLRTDLVLRESIKCTLSKGEGPDPAHLELVGLRAREQRLHVMARILDERTQCCGSRVLAPCGTANCCGAQNFRNLARFACLT